MSFDRVAGIYDVTRGLPREAVTRVVDGIIAATHAGPETRFLELGVGTGRIALPFIERGYSYTGVDIAQAMMARLQAKIEGEVGEAGNVTLLHGSVTDLPLPNDSFDVVLIVHVLHLVPNWHKALEEARRVLTPHGYLVLGHDHPLPDSSAAEIRRQWRVFVEEEGGTLRPEYGSWQTVQAEVTEQGGRTAVYWPAQWDKEFPPIELIRSLRERVFSQAWEVSDEVLERVHQRLLAWAQERYGSLEQPQLSRWQFLISVSRFA